MPPIAAGVWRLVDPRISLASVASLVVGGAAAVRDGPVHWGWFALTATGIFCVEAAKNASGEIVDWDSGTDRAITEDERTPFSGGKRVIVDGLLSRRQTTMAAGAFYAAAFAVGLVIIAVREPGVAYLALAGVALAFFYHAAPLRLSYRGFGELAVTLAYGPGIAAGTYLVQRHTIGGEVVWATVPLGIAIGAFLWINEFPDARADAQAGKRTLVVRLGRPAAVRGFILLVGTANALVVLLPLAGLPSTVWLGLVGLPHAVAAARRLGRFAATPARLVPAQSWTLLSFVLMAFGLGTGLVSG